MHQDSSSVQPSSALGHAVSTTTDQGIADPPAINTSTDKSAAESDTTAIPSSPSKSPGFFSRILGGFMGSTPEPAESTASGTYSSQAPSASWGTGSDSQPVEHIREAGATRAEESGLDEPTATKQVGLEGASGGDVHHHSPQNTAVAAAESLVDDKASAQHDTALAGRQAHYSPGAPLLNVSIFAYFNLICCQSCFALNCKNLMYSFCTEILIAIPSKRKFRPLQTYDLALHDILLTKLSCTKHLAFAAMHTCWYC